MTIARRLFAEALGSMLLAATVIGSGIMAEQLAAGNIAVALVANTGATVAVLAVLIAMLAPISDAHFNPAVSLVQSLRGELRTAEAFGYAAVQIAGCVAGALLAHAMFGESLFQSSAHIRTGMAQWLSETIATGGLILVILSCPSYREAAWRVPAWIGAAYWFTASTSFANPAITIGRALSDTFAGIRPEDGPMFIGAQLIGALTGLGLAKALFASQVGDQPRRCRKRGGVMSATIYHNPDCATSRNTLGLIRNAGVEPTIIEYLRHPPTREELASLIAAGGLSVREALRQKGTPFDELGLGNTALSDDQLLDAMMAHPILINRPLVKTPLGTRLCRPSELVLEILPAPQKGFFAKEDGQVVIDERGQRVG